MVTIQLRQRPPAGKVSDDAMRRRETSVVDERDRSTGAHWRGQACLMIPHRRGSCRPLQCCWHGRGVRGLIGQGNEGHINLSLFEKGSYFKQEPAGQEYLDDRPGNMNCRARV
jgi:hypothetical protein